MGIQSTYTPCRTDQEYWNLQKLKLEIMLNPLQHRLHTFEDIENELTLIHEGMVDFEMHEIMNTISIEQYQKHYQKTCECWRCKEEREGSQQ